MSGARECPTQKKHIERTLYFGEIVQTMTARRMSDFQGDAPKCAIAGLNPCAERHLCVHLRCRRLPESASCESVHAVPPAPDTLGNQGVPP